MTKVIFNIRVEFDHVGPQGEVLEIVDEYIYQGQFIQANTSSEEEIKPTNWEVGELSAHTVACNSPLCLSLQPMRPPSMICEVETNTVKLLERKRVNEQKEMERLMLDEDNVRG